jgi:hypothetical protein
MPPRRRVGGHINLPPVHSFVRLDCPAISSYSFGATALIFCRMFTYNGGVHVHRILMVRGGVGGIICVL